MGLPAALLTARYMVKPISQWSAKISVPYDEWALNSNASRLGIKGKTEISEGLEIVYQAEYEVCIDSGDCKGQTFKQRNTFVGITKVVLAMVWAGKHDTPTKLSQKKN